MSVVLFKNYRFCLALSICLPSLHALGSPFLPGLILALFLFITLLMLLFRLSELF